MLIRCPECHFDRQIDDAAIPPSAAVATCPRCQCRFRFRHPDGSPVVEQPEASSEPLTSAVADAQEGAPSLPPDMMDDDPLPPGAVIPNIPGVTTDKSASPSSVSPAQTPSRAGDSASETNAAVRSAETKTAASGAPRAGEEGSGKGKKSASLWQDKGNQPENELLVPWELPRRYGFFMGLYQTILRVMFQAPSFFAGLPSSTAGLGRPLAFYLILGLVQKLAEHAWLRMSGKETITAVSNPNMQEMLGQIAQNSVSLPLIILTTPAFHTIQLLFFTAVFFLMLRLVQPDTTDFRTVFRVIAYSAAPTIVGVIPVVGSLVGVVWFGVCCFIGCKYAFRLPWAKTALALVPLYVIAFGLTLQFMRQLLSMVDAGLL